MKICGIQKTTLIDYPEKIACIIFLYGCNFRCGFCHNPELVTEKNENVFSEKHVLDFLEKRKKYLEGVCITGGEPLISIEKDFLKKIKELGYQIKIDTNGSFPEILEELVQQGLVDYIAMDIKGSREKYNRIAGTEVNLDRIENSIKLICDFGNYEFRTTVLKKFHDEEEIEKIGKWLNEICKKKPKRYFLQGFKNNQKFINDDYKFEKDISLEYLEKMKKIAEKYFEEVGVRT